jgi:hypothetical protein
MNEMIKIRVYNIGYEVYDYESPEDLDWNMSQEDYDEYRDELENEMIIEIDPEELDWSMEGIEEYIVDYITDETGETFSGYDYEVLVDIREIKINKILKGQDNF